MNNDLIDRTALLRKWDEKFFSMGGDRLGPNGDEIMWYLNSLLDEIKNAPTVDLWQMRQEATENAIKKAEVLYGRPQGEWKSLGFVHSRGYAWCTCSNCGKTTKIYLDKDNDFCCIADIRNKAVACLFCGADMRKPNCVRCDHFGKCEGCEKRDEE